MKFKKGDDVRNVEEMNPNADIKILKGTHGVVDKAMNTGDGFYMVKFDGAEPLIIVREDQIEKA